MFWSEQCDMDLHLEQPDGEEIFAFNRQNSQLTGLMDTDDQAMGASPYLENIGFLPTTPPSGIYKIYATNFNGDCPAHNYNIYLQLKVNGVFTMTKFEMTAPNGNNAKVMLTSFEYAE